MSFVLLISKKVPSESIHYIDTHFDVIVEVLEVHISVAFDICLDEDFIEFWWAYLMFESSHANNFCRISTLQWCIPLVIRYHSGSILSLWWILLVWLVFWNFNLIHHWCDHFCESIFEILRFLIIKYFILSSIVAFMVSNWSSGLLSIFFHSLGIMKLDVWRGKSQE